MQSCADKDNRTDADRFASYALRALRNKTIYKQIVRAIDKGDKTDERVDTIIRLVLDCLETAKRRTHQTWIKRPIHCSFKKMKTGVKIKDRQIHF